MFDGPLHFVTGGLGARMVPGTGLWLTRGGPWGQGYLGGGVGREVGCAILYKLTQITERRLT